MVYENDFVSVMIGEMQIQNTMWHTLERTMATSVKEDMGEGTAQSLLVRKSTDSIILESNQFWILIKQKLNIELPYHADNFTSWHLPQGLIKCSEKTIAPLCSL